MTFGIPATTIGVFEIVGALLVLLALTWGALALPPLPRRVSFPRWAQGWLIPHYEARDNCRVECATCRSGS